MTRHADLKRLIRSRMAATGENYTAARAALMAERATDPNALLRPPGVPPRPATEQAPAPDPVAARGEHERLIRPFWRQGRLQQIPTKRRARFAVLLEVLARFTPGESFTEAEVGEVLSAVHPDVAYLRRELVDYGLLTRVADGSAYRVASALPDRSGNMTQEVTDWERVWLPRFLAGELVLALSERPGPTSQGGTTVEASKSPAHEEEHP